VQLIADARSHQFSCIAPSCTGQWRNDVHRSGWRAKVRGAGPTALTADTTARSMILTHDTAPSRGSSRRRTLGVRQRRRRENRHQIVGCDNIAASAILLRLCLRSKRPPMSMFGRTGSRTWTSQSGLGCASSSGRSSITGRPTIRSPSAHRKGRPVPLRKPMRRRRLSATI